MRCTVSTSGNQIQFSVEIVLTRVSYQVYRDEVMIPCDDAESSRSIVCPRLRALDG